MAQLTSQRAKSLHHQRTRFYKMPRRLLPLLAFAILACMSFLPFVRAEIDMQTGKECVDEHENCAFWASTGECTKNRNYMGQYCRKSCDKCKVVRLGDHAEIDKFMARKKEEIFRKRQEAKEKREALKVLEGKDL